MSEKNPGLLSVMLVLQDRLTRLLFDNAETGIEYGSPEHVAETVASLAVEASEAFAPFLTRTKPWKDPVPDMAHVDEEMVDVLHFLLTYWNLRGKDAVDIFKEYDAKNRKNQSRLAAKLAEGGAA